MAVRRTVLLRILTAVWGFWFAAAFLEVPGVHACAVHDSAAASGVHAHHHHDSAPNRKGEHCTCLSSCCSATPVAISAPSIVVETTTVEVEAVDFHAPTISVVATRPYARPFANGPPVA